MPALSERKRVEGRSRDPADQLTRWGSRRTPDQRTNAPGVGYWLPPVGAPDGPFRISSVTMPTFSIPAPLAASMTVTISP